MGNALHHMLDLETCDTRPSAIVVSIGIVAFDPQTFETTGNFYRVLKRMPQRKRGRTTSPTTMSWWNAQTPEARAVFEAPTTPVEDALVDMREFLKDTGGVWGNGASFDNVIVADLYRSFDQDPAWPFYRDRCFRTIKSLPMPVGFVPPARQGVFHNALDDALHQVRALDAICEALQLSL